MRAFSARSRRGQGSAETEAPPTAYSRSMFERLRERYHRRLLGEQDGKKAAEQEREWREAFPWMHRRGALNRQRLRWLSTLPEEDRPVAAKLIQDQDKLAEFRERAIHSITLKNRFAVEQSHLRSLVERLSESSAAGRSVGETQKLQEAVHRLEAVSKRCHELEADALAIKKEAITKEYGMQMRLAEARVRWGSMPPGSQDPR